MKLDLGIHIAMHSVLSLKPGVTNSDVDDWTLDQGVRLCTYGGVEARFFLASPTLASQVKPFWHKACIRKINGEVTRR